MSTLHRLALAGALVAGTAFVTTRVVSAEREAPQDEGDMQEMMAQMMKLAAPGPQHEKLTDMAGDWEALYEMRWDPDGEWMKTTGKTSAKSLLGGRYLMEEVSFEVMGMPMKGVQILGYDNQAEEYISLWMDTSSTWWVTARGKANEAGDIELKGTMKDIAGERPYRMVIRHPEEGRVVSEMYDTIPPHGEILVMKMDSKRLQ